MTGNRIVVIIPAFNEENAVGRVIRAIPENLVSEIAVVDNNSSDTTAVRAAEQNVTVLFEERKGYGWACLKGISYFASQNPLPDIVVFLDADYSDYPEEMHELVKPILDEEADMVIGSRALGKKEKGSVTPQQIFGNWLATFLIRLFYGYRFTDLGPFRAVKFNQLMELEMTDKTYGWTVEMQIKAIKMNFRCIEVPVNYRKRIGFSKVSGTLKGTLGAGFRIIKTIFKYL